MQKTVNLSLKLIVGLGNPGQEYTRTRHNIGFMVLEKILEKNNQEKTKEISFQNEKKFKSEIAIIQDAEEKIILAKPNTFMNKSGQAIKELVSFYKIDLANLLLVHDDLDLLLGTVRISKDRGSAGHNGVRSTIKELGTKNFSRIRFGISTEDRKQLAGEKFVLGNFSKEEETQLDFELCEKMIWSFVKNGFTKTANKYNQSLLQE